MINTESDLLAQAVQWTGQTLGCLKNYVDKIHCQSSYTMHKGITGQWFERALGADAGNLSAPDFTQLGIELKTLPIGKHGIPRESTFVTAISLTHIAQESWDTSKVYAKLRRVLWIPVEGDPEIPLLERRIGTAFLWSADVAQLSILQADWQALSNRIVLGELDSISAKDGTYLQIRPKAANGQSLSYGIDDMGNAIKTLPRGFYLRACFTTELLKQENTLCV